MNSATGQLCGGTVSVAPPGDVVMGVTAYPFLAPFPARISEVQRGICKFNALLQAPCDRLCSRRDVDAALFRQKVRSGKIAFARVVVETDHPASRWAEIGRTSGRARVVKNV